MPSTTNLEGKEIVDAPGKDGNASTLEQVKRPKPWTKMMMTFIHTSHTMESNTCKSKEGERKGGTPSCSSLQILSIKI
jgi:hypothetical protein